MTTPRKIPRDSLTSLVQQVDQRPRGELPPDTVPSGFPSLDRMLGGGFRHRDLVILGGDVGSGKSALALAIALRAASTGRPVTFLSGEMDEDRLMERALALEARVAIDDMRMANVTDTQRSAIGAAALKYRELELRVFPMVGADFDEVLAPARGERSSLVVVDYLQLVPPTAPRVTQDEDSAQAVRALKALALDGHVACLVVAQLPLHIARRADPRPALDDFGALGAVKQHADIVLALYREEMYNPGGGVEGATELIVAKNRNGPTGFVDLYFYQKWVRFEDMLDPDR